MCVCVYELGRSRYSVYIGRKENQGTDRGVPVDANGWQRARELEDGYQSVGRASYAKGLN